MEFEGELAVDVLVGRQFVNSSLSVQVSEGSDEKFISWFLSLD